MLIGFVVFLCISLILLSYGVYNIVIIKPESAIDYTDLINSLTANPNANPFNLPNSQSGQVQFELPITYMNWTLPITLNFTVTNDIALVQNTLSEMNTTISFSNVSDQSEAVSIGAIQIQPVSAISVQPNSDSSSGYSNFGYSSLSYIDIYPFESINSSTNQIWSTTSYGVFQNTGTVTLYIQVSMAPSLAMQDKIYSYLNQNNQQYQYSYNTNLTLPNITIISESQLTEQQRTEQQQDIQQRETSLQTQLQALQVDLLTQAKDNQNYSETLNLGLTSFILFFASLDIAFIIYDHSEDKDKKTQYYDESEIDY
jgi:hypothetical protein